MNHSGYSRKPLAEKLGYKPYESIYLLNAPDEFQLYLKTKFIKSVSKPPATWLHGFFMSQSQLEHFLDSISFDDVEKGFWVSWPKKSSAVTSDLTEQTFRDHILPLGWVDTKVAAIDETWSGLKFLRHKN
jgi:hypothetical protein